MAERDHDPGPDRQAATTAIDEIARRGCRQQQPETGHRAVEQGAEADHQPQRTAQSTPAARACAGARETASSSHCGDIGSPTSSSVAIWFTLAKKPTAEVALVIS